MFNHTFHYLWHSIPISMYFFHYCKNVLCISCVKGDTEVTCLIILVQLEENRHILESRSLSTQTADVYNLIVLIKHNIYDFLVLPKTFTELFEHKDFLG